MSSNFGSAPSGSQITWLFDPYLQQWFWYHSQRDILIYSNGQTIPRDQRVPRSAFRSTEDYQTFCRQSLNSNTSNPPPDNSSSYTTDPQRPTSDYQQHYASRTAGGTSSGAPARANNASRPGTYRSSASNRSGSVVDSFANLSLNQPTTQEQRPQYSRSTEGHYFSSRTGANAPTDYSSQQYMASGSTTSGHYLTRAVQKVPVVPGEQQQQKQLGADQQAQNNHANDEHNMTSAVPNVYRDASGTVMEMRNAQNGVLTIYRTEPAEQITDSNLYRSGVRATRYLLPTGREGDEEQLFDTFRVRDQPRRFFTIGKVFLVLWVEPAGENKTVITSIQPGTTLGRFGEKVFSKVRRFVVIREGENFCSALPIATYGHQGVGKQGVNKSEHGIIYTGKKAPEPLPIELAVRGGETGMRPQPIRVDPDQPDGKLDPLSRIDYAKVHTIHHNIKVKSFGKVNSKSEAALQHQFQSVWMQPSRRARASESNVASSSRGNEDNNAPAAMRRQRTSTNPSSGGHSSQAAASTSSRGRRDRGRSERAVEDSDEDDLEDVEEEDEEEDDDDDDDDRNNDPSNGRRSNVSDSQRRSEMIADLRRQGYSEQRAIQILRDRIDRRRRESRGSRNSK